MHYRSMKLLKFSIPRIIKMIIIIALIIMAICFCVSKLLNPTWKETYSYKDDSIIVVNSKGPPVKNALVVQVTAKTGWVGGWGCPSSAPSDGDESWGSPKEEFSVRSFFSDSKGMVPYKPFITDGEGRKDLIGGHRKHGFVRNLVYKRGYSLKKIKCRVNMANDSKINLSNLKHRSPLRSGAEDVLKLLCPFPFADTTMQKAYWSHVLPNGVTVKDYVLHELDRIETTTTRKDRKELVRQVINLIKNEDYDGYPANYYNLVEPLRNKYGYIF